jgi:hypothetical protein
MRSTYSDKNYHFIHKHSLTIIILFALIILFPTLADAGAESGEFFGYKIGNKYSVNKNTIVKKSNYGGIVLDYLFEIVTEDPINPKEIQEVSVSTTIQTFTIIEIFSRNKFDSHKKACDFADKYAAILRAKYPEAIDNNSNYKKLSVAFNKEYQLTVDMPAILNLLSHIVEIKLEAIGSLSRKLHGLKNKEYDAVLLQDASKSEDFAEGL